MANDPASSGVPPRFGDIDLYCLKCGYNLRGLSGDPRRCPECGHMNPLGDLELPAEMISRQLRKMETAPTVCVGVALALLLLFAFVVALAPGLPDLFTGLCCAGGPALVALIIWIGCAGSFCRSCGTKPGWMSVLWHYHLYGVGSCAFVLFGYLVAPVLIVKLMPGLRVSDRLHAIRLCSIGWTICVLILIAWRAPRLRAKARQEMETLQREVAVSIARETLKNALAARREWGTTRKL